MRSKLVALAAGAGIAASSAGHAVIPDEVPSLPVLLPATPPGTVVASPAAAVTPTQKTIDGAISDWVGENTGLGAAAIYSKGEYVYQDYVNDAWGGDDGYDYGRLYNQSGTGVGLGTLAEVEPRLYRVDALQQGIPGQVGDPLDQRPIGAEDHYGDANLKAGISAVERHTADIVEARVAAGDTDLFFLVRTIGMLSSNTTAALILLDTEAGGSYALPTAMGGPQLATAAEWAILAFGDQVVRALYKGDVTSCTDCAVATNPGCALGSSGCSLGSAHINAIEVSIPRVLVGSPSSLGVGVATGIIDSTSSPTGLKNAAQDQSRSSLINVAFRHDEPVRIRMDQSQAMALLAGNVDKYLTEIDIEELLTGGTEDWDYGPGYYEAVYATETAPIVANEVSFDQSMYQGYGLYVPKAYDSSQTLPAQFWMHFRGGSAHSAGAWLPGVADQFGEKAGTSPLCYLGDPAGLAECGAFVVTPSARGGSTWYTGRGMVDFTDVWDDSHERLPIDEDRTYLAGHSMGGWASYLLGLLMPDRWAASSPESGLLVPALCLGPVGFSGQNGQSADSNLYNILENGRNVPFAIHHGVADELVPIACALAAGAKLQTLGYRYRNYTFPYDHFGPPIIDEYHDIVRYMHQFQRDPNPARVDYTTWPFLNNQINTVNGSPGLSFNFNGAYWVSDMAVRTAGIAASNRGRVNAMTWGRTNRYPITYPEAGVPAHGFQGTMHGQAWVPLDNDINPPSDLGGPQNRFTAALTNLSTVTFDIARMGLSTGSAMTAAVTPDGNSTLVLDGNWASAPTVAGGTDVTASWDSATGRLTLTFAGSGTRNLTITP
jgi:hypothetical protein